MICRHKLYHFMVANLVFPRRVSGAVKRVFATVKWYNLCLQIIQTQIVLSPFEFILIKRIFKTFSFCCYVALLRTWRHRCFHGINGMILMPQILDVTANENARYKRNELECYILEGCSQSQVYFSALWHIHLYLYSVADRSTHLLPLFVAFSSIISNTGWTTTFKPTPLSHL